MTVADKIDSNATGLSYAEEQTLKVLPVTPIWNELEPNSYSDFGGQTTKVSRKPIVKDRQRKKGSTSGLDASGGWNNDLTQSNLQDILQGFFFADLRRKAEQHDTVVKTGPAAFTVPTPAAWKAGDIFKSTGHAVLANNGIFYISAVSGSDLQVSGSVTAEASPPTASKLVKVGFRFDSGDATINVSGTFPKLVTTTKNLTELGLIPGEWVWLGGDSSVTKPINAVNTGFKRVRSVAAGAIEFDKSMSAMVADAGTAKTVEIYFGRVLKNEGDSSLIKRRSYNLERQLGRPDSGIAGTQAEYLEGAVANELTINVKQEDKVTIDLSFVALAHTRRTQTEDIKSGTRNVLAEADCFNTSTDFSRIKMAKVSTDEAQTPLYAYFQEFTVTINNNVTVDKAVGVLGGFDVTVGGFDVGGSASGYFSSVDAIAAVQDNDDVSLDCALVRDNAGIVVDLPLLTLGDGRLAVEVDKPVMIPLTLEAATAAKVDPNMDYSLMMVFFDYLPDAAE